jgi:hypothetical protein
MLSTEQISLLEELEKSDDLNRLHPIERQWIYDFKNKFNNDSKYPCEMSQKMLKMIYRKVTDPNWRVEDGP